MRLTRTAVSAAGDVGFVLPTMEQAFRAVEKQPNLETSSRRAVTCRRKQDRRVFLYHNERRETKLVRSCSENLDRSVFVM